MTTHTDGQPEQDRVDELLHDTTIVDLLRLAFQAGHAAARYGTFSVADSRLQALFNRINTALQERGDEQEPPTSGVRSGGDW